MAIYRWFSQLETPIYKGFSMAMLNNHMVDFSCLEDWTSIQIRKLEAARRGTVCLSTTLNTLQGTHSTSSLSSDATGLFFLAHKVGDVKVEYENSQLLHFLDMKPSECRGWRLTFWHVCVLVDTGDPASNDFPAFLTSKQRHQWYVFAYQYLLTSFMSASCPRFCPPCLLHRSATEIPNLLRWFSHFEGDLPFSLVISFLLLLKPCILDFFGWLFIMGCFANQFFAEQKKTRSLFKLFFPLGTPRMLTFFLPRFLSIRALQCTWWHRRGCCLRRCGRRGVR